MKGGGEPHCQVEQLKLHLYLQVDVIRLVEAVCLQHASVNIGTCSYCTLIVPLCSISYIMANHPISSEIGRLAEEAIWNHGWCVLYTINFSLNG